MNDLIVTAIRSQPAKYSTDPDGLIALKGAGASDKVIAAIVDRMLVPERNRPVDNAKPLEPELIGVVYYLDSSNKTIRPLPKEEWKARGKLSGLFSATGAIQMEGTVSSLRIGESDKVEFVFKIDHPDDVKIYKCTRDAKKNFREFVVVKNQRGGAVQERLDGVPVDVIKYGDSSFKLTAKSLVRGEYAIVTGAKIFSFGISDPL